MAGQNEGVKRTLLFALALIAVGCAEEPAPKDLDELVQQADECLGAPQEGYERCWDVFVPDGLSGSVPLLVDLHGWFEVGDPPGTGTKEKQRSVSGFEEIAELEQFIVVWPQGIKRSWNAGGMRWTTPEEPDSEGCCGAALLEGIDDVGFIKEMVLQVSSRYPVDKERVFATGISNGCAMAQRLAAQASDFFSGVACMAMYLLDNVSENYSPIPILEIHGTADGVVGYDSSTQRWQGATRNLLAWKNHNECKGELEVVQREEGHEIVRISDCENDADVALVTVFGAGHVPYKGVDSLELNTSWIAWEFLKTASK